MMINVLNAHLSQIISQAISSKCVGTGYYFWNITLQMHKKNLCVCVGSVKAAT